MTILPQATPFEPHHPASPSLPTTFRPSPQLPAVLHLTLPAVQSISGPDGLSSLWHVFSKCKSSLQDGERLENISWRLWAQACADECQVPRSGGKDGREGKSVMVVTPGRNGRVRTIVDSGEGSDDDDASGSSDWEDEDTAGSSSEEDESGVAPDASAGPGLATTSADTARHESALRTERDVRMIDRQLSPDPTKAEADTATLASDDDDDDSSGFETTSDSDSDEDVEALTMATSRVTPTTASTQIKTPSASTLAGTMRPIAGRRRGTVEGKVAEEVGRLGPVERERQRTSSFASSAGSRMTSTSFSRGRGASDKMSAARDRKGSRGSQRGEESSSASRAAKVKALPTPPRASSSTATPGLSTSTPKASSYPTPSQSIRPSYNFVRSQSHLPGDPTNVLLESALTSAAVRAEQQRQASQAEAQAEMFALAKARRANRPFGEVLRDMFRVPSVNEVVEACAAASASASGGGEELKRKISIGALGGTGSTPTAPTASTTPAVQSHQPASVTQRQVEQDSHPSDMDTHLPSGPELRLVEPTPAPPRVGSLNGGSLNLSRHSPLTRHDAGISSISPRQQPASFGFGSIGLTPMTRMRAGSSEMSHSPVYSPQLEKADPMSSLTVSPTSQEIRSSQTRHPRASASATSSSSMLAPAVPLGNAAVPSAPPAAKPKDKKSMFYIQSPGDRYGSASGSETSTSSMTSRASRQTASTKTGGTPLATIQLPEIDTARPRVQSPPQLRPAVSRDSTFEQLPRSPEEALTRVPSRRVSANSSGSGKHAHPGPPQIRRVSGEAHKETQKSHASRQMGANGGNTGLKRTSSAAQMAGKFQGEKARAAAAIAARLQAQQELERQKQIEQRRQHLTMAKRQQSTPNLEQLRQNAARSAEVVTASNEDDEDWSSETDEPSNEAKGAIMFGKGKGKARGKTLPMDLTRAADEAQRQRELFAKKAIFGSVPRAEVPGLSGISGGSRLGLLSNLFETQRDVIRKGDSMVNLQKAMPSTDHLPINNKHGHGHGLASNFPLNRTKSVVAMPQTSGVSVGRSGFVAPPQAPSTTSPPSNAAPRGNLRLPPRPGPATLSAEDMSPSSSPENDNAILATSAAVKRLEAIGARRQSKPTAPTEVDAPREVLPQPARTAVNPAVQAVISQPMQRASSNPITTQFNNLLPSIEPSMPQTPTTRRRQMLATELPEDLRLNLLWERRSRAPMYPNKRSSALKPSASAHDLPATNLIQRELPEGPSPDLRRQFSDNVAAQIQPRGSYEGPAAAARRKPGPNLLSGGNLLRPMTSLARGPEVERPASAGGMASGAAKPAADSPTSQVTLAQRSKSVVNMAEYRQQNQQQGPGPGSQHNEGGLRRRITDGDIGPEQIRRTRNLREREGESSSSFRSHGW